MAYKVSGTYNIAEYILAVAMTELDGSHWTSYVGIKRPGETEEDAAGRISKHGTKLQHHVADAIFPRMKQQYIWRK